MSASLFFSQAVVAAPAETAETILKKLRRSILKAFRSFPAYAEV
jgi:hypothetical protein